MQHPSHNDGHAHSSPSGQAHHPSRLHDPAIFISGSPALDFLNSIATPADAAIDWLDSGEGLLDWLEQAGLIAPDASQDIRGRALPGELDGVATRARGLREWFREFVRDRRGRPLAVEALKALEPLNILLERDETYTRIVASSQDITVPLELRAMRRWRSAESLLLPVAEALARFVCSEDFTNVKSCEGARCTLMFADHTRGRRRRFCSTAVCGNRAKVAAHRERTKQAIKASRSVDVG